jgi:low molecular weight protein-tyrosine phosphatase
MRVLLDKLKRGAADDEGPPVDTPASDYRVLFVCMGNICRSPTAEGVFRKRVAAELPDLVIEIDSAGTHAYHVGAAPDARARRAAASRGVDLQTIRARRVEPEDFEHFDLVLAMDELNHVALLEICPAERNSRVRLFLDFAPQLELRNVPDPYYGGPNGFEHVLDLVEEASAGLIEYIRREVATTTR